MRSETGEPARSCCPRAGRGPRRRERKRPSLRISSTAHSPRRLLELPVAASTDNHDLPIISGPDDLAMDTWMTVEGSEAVPHRGFEGVAEFVAPRPAFDVHEGLALKTKKLDHVRVAAASGLT